MSSSVDKAEVPVSELNVSFASENLGYSKMVPEQAIARHDSGCRVVVYLRHTPEAGQAEGREYFKGV